MADIYGTVGDDTLTGTSEDDYIYARAGRDTLNGQAGADYLSGGSGTDRLTGGAGNDSLSGDDGADTYIFADDWGQDQIYEYDSTTNRIIFQNLTENDVDFSTDGNDLYIDSTLNNNYVRLEDYYYYNSSFDIIYLGQPGTPPPTPTEGDDTLTGTSGNDSISALGGNDTVRGGAGDDRLGGDTGNDQLYGEDDNDILKGGRGDDRLEGGAGTDTIEYAHASADFDVTKTSTGYRIVHARGSADTGTDTLVDIEQAQFTDGLFDIDSLPGGSVRATPGNDTLQLGNGDDFLDALAGNDMVRGGGGNDTLIGNTGNDTLYGQDGNDTVEGKDGNDKLAGDAGNDTVRGGVGKDLLYGGQGADEFELDAANESVAGSNRDTAQDWAKGDKFDIASVTFNGGSAAAKFKFVGKGAVDDPGEVGFTNSGGNTIVRGGTDGDAAAEFEILIPKSVTLTASDFIL